jgi:hypothetical protein
MSEESYRLSDAERDRVVEDLKEHLVQGRLTLEEYSDRVEIALRARVTRDLDVVRHELPATSTDAARSSRRRTSLGRWSTAISVCSDVDLDLREASVDGLRSTISVFALMGNVDVYVPEGIDVDVSGLAVFGHRRDWGRDVSSPSAAVMRVRVFGVIGTVDVWRVPSGAPTELSAVIALVKSGHRARPVEQGGGDVALPAPD